LIFIIRSISYPQKLWWVGIANFPGRVGSNCDDHDILPRCIYAYKKIRDDIKQIENEFADAMFILGRRISEGRSAEEAFIHTSETMKGSKIGEAFADIAKNLSSMRTTLHGAIFNEEYGAFKDIYSDRVHTIMKLLTRSVHRSHEAAGMAIIKIADHLKELQDVEKISEGRYMMLLLLWGQLPSFLLPLLQV